MQVGEESTDNDVLVTRTGSLGRISLNRPSALNALTLDMVRTIAEALHEFDADPEIGVVLLDSTDARSFCAGGDIRAVRQAVLDGRPEDGRRFFREEYRLNAAIARSATPVVALMDGIVLGGGVGLAGHAAHRVVTERVRVGMPEVAIGFVTDVGATWLLSRGTSGLGRHAALTGAHLGPAATVAAGLADAVVSSAALPELVAALGDADLDAFRRAVESHRIGDASPTSPWIDECYAHDSVEEIVGALQAHGDPDAEAAAGQIRAGSPTSCTVVLRALRTAERLDDLETALDMEFGIASVLIETHDFLEGVRAVLVDKDRSPRWDPADLASVDPTLIERCFAPHHHEPPFGRDVQ